MMRMLKNAMALLGAAYILNCGSTVVVEMAESEDSPSTSSGARPSTGSGMMPGMGGMGGSVAWAQNVAFNYVTATCPEIGMLPISSDQFEPSLWPLVSGWVDLYDGDVPIEYQPLSPDATQVWQSGPAMLRFDTGDMAYICGPSGASLTLALPVYAE